MSVVSNLGCGDFDEINIFLPVFLHQHGVGKRLMLDSCRLYLVSCGSHMCGTRQVGGKVVTIAGLQMENLMVHRYSETGCVTRWLVPHSSCVGNDVQHARYLIYFFCDSVLRGWFKIEGGVIETRYFFSPGGSAPLAESGTSRKYAETTS